MTSENAVVEIGDAIDHATKYSGLGDAIDLASDQDRSTWLTSDGKKIAAIMPVADAEYIANALRSGEGMALIRAIFRIIRVHEVTVKRYAGGHLTNETCNCGLSWDTLTYSHTRHLEDTAEKWLLHRNPDLEA